MQGCTYFFINFLYECLKMKKILLISASVFLTTSMAQAAPVTVNGGTVHFTGEFVSAACAVSADTANQAVALGQYRTSSLTEAGQFTTNVPFRIKLVDCDPEISQNASFAFNGPLDLADPTLLRVSSDGASSDSVAAKGVGIEINDSQGTVLTPDGTVFSAQSALIAGNNTVHFVARYKSTSAGTGLGGTVAQPAYAVTAGQANASANFVITYD